MVAAFRIRKTGRTNLFLQALAGSRITVEAAGYQGGYRTRHARFEAVTDTGNSDGKLLAPMPGKILEIRTEKGAKVSEVENLAVETGELVEADVVLLEIGSDNQG